LDRSPGRTARIAGLFDLLVFITGTYALLGLPGAMVANLSAAVCYVAVTVLFYFVFKPAGPGLSLLAAMTSLAGCVLAALAEFKVLNLNPLVFFGFYCLMIGALIFRSRFLPHWLGYGMMIGGIGWLTFIAPTFAASLFPYNIFPGAFGEGLLTLWLVFKSVDEQRWKEQAASLM
jgi:hypothetical protein